MALLLPGGHLGGLGRDAREAGGPGEGVLVPPTVPDGLRWGLETGELAHLVDSLPFAKDPSPARVVELESTFAQEMPVGGSEC